MGDEIKVLYIRYQELLTISISCHSRGAWLSVRLFDSRLAGESGPESLTDLVPLLTYVEDADCREFARGQLAAEKLLWTLDPVSSHLHHGLDILLLCHSVALHVRVATPGCQPTKL